MLKKGRAAVLPLLPSSVPANQTMFRQRSKEVLWLYLSNTSGFFQNSVKTQHFILRACSLAPLKSSTTEIRSVTPGDALSGPAPHRRAVQQDADQGSLSNTCFSCYNHTSQITAWLTCGHGWAASFWNRARYTHAAPLVVRRLSDRWSTGGLVQAVTEVCSVHALRHWEPTSSPWLVRWSPHFFHILIAVSKDFLMRSVSSDSRNKWFTLLWHLCSCRDTVNVLTF